MNRIMIRTLAVAVAVTGVLGFSGIAQAWGGDCYGNGGGYRGGYGAEMTGEQQSAAQKMHADFYTATENVRQQMMSKQAELDAQLYSEKPDAKKIESLTAEIGALRGKMLVERTNLEAKMSKDGIPSYGRDGYGHRGGRGGWGHGGGRGGHGGGHGW